MNTHFIQILDPDVAAEPAPNPVRIVDPHAESMFLHLLNTCVHSYNQAACEHQIAGDLVKQAYFKGKADAFAAAARHYAEMVNENGT